MFTEYSWIAGWRSIVVRRRATCLHPISSGGSSIRSVLGTGGGSGNSNAR